MGMGYVARAVAEESRLRRIVEQRDGAGGDRDVRGLVGDWLADLGLGEAEVVGQQECLAILRKALAPVLVHRMDRHGEEAELHDASRGSRPTRI